ncbi:MAG: PPC domain-containing protein [Kofleriaceae bacterium]
MKRTSSLVATIALATTVVPACTDDSFDPYDDQATKSEDGKADASALAVFLDFEFSGRLTTTAAFNNEQLIEDQLLFTVGQLNGVTAVGRVDKVELTDVQRTFANGLFEITYKAKLPVAWGRRASIPETFDFKLPLNVSINGQASFLQKYKDKCIDFNAHDLDAGNLFYYYRPDNAGCTLNPADILATTATVSPSPVQTNGKFPEYDKIYEDGVFNVVAIFGKYTDGATGANDAGIKAYNEFVRLMKIELAGLPTTTIPATVPTDPGVAAPDLEFNVTLPDGKKVHIVALLTDNVTDGLMQPAFRTRYNTLSSRADLITYNGHAGLGKHVRALANAGAWVAGQYVIVYINGCDTFAYIDDALQKAHKRINPDDTTGYKYVDIVNNAMPADFASMPQATMAMFRGLLEYNAPRTFEQLFYNIDRTQIALVVGEQDNTYTPGPSGPVEAWEGLKVTFPVAQYEMKQFSTPIIEAGRYLFAMSGTNDADLYVRVGSEPTLSKYDCRPYKVGSTETCEITIARPTQIFVGVRGFSPLGSRIDLVGKKL